MRLSDLSDTSADALRSASTYLSDLATPTLRLGVTGLSRAGKTVFITGLVNALISGSAKPALPLAHLPGFRAFLEPQPDDDVPRFAYEQHLAVLRGSSAAWPDGTRHISQLRITLEWEATDWARRTAGITRSLHIDITDYPGEWLLDLALLDQTYAQWSAQMNRSMAQRPRDGNLETWLAFAQHTSPSAEPDEQIALEGARLFTGYLQSARDNDRFARLISPGRFLLPGDLAGSPLLTFFPLAIQPDDVSRPGTLCALMERRFESYKSQVVRPFFERHFRAIDRQIVLVDALNALNGGPEAVSELEEALQGALQAFRPGRRSWLATILGRRIDKVLFVATKADHIHRSNHGRLRNIMRALLGRATKRVEATGADFETDVLASLRTTTDVDYRKGEDVMPCIQGRPLAGEVTGKTTFDGRQSTALFPGDLPDDPLDIFDTEQFAAGSLNFVTFQPPELDDKAGRPIAWPHIGLDRALQYLVGDRLA